MADSRLISRCGIYCGACYIYRAERDGGKLLDEVSRRFGVPKEAIKCNGCSASVEEQWRNCQNCGYKTCQSRRGVENCAQCSGFDVCPDYNHIEAFTAKRDEDIRGSLRRINAGEGDTWLAAQDERWRCPKCGQLLSWYDNTCRTCGRKLREKPVTMDD
jgi:hypothetical protein